MANPRKRKHQSGSVWLRGSNFYLRYYGPDRRQKTELLCARDDKHHSRTCAPVKKLAAAAMARVNSGVGAASQSPTVSEFWEKIYLPFAEKNLRPSTVGSYKDLWARHLKPHFDGTRLGEYHSSDGTAFLTKLAERLGRNSLNHVRSLMSGIFSHAAALGRVAHNPMRDAKVLGRTMAPSNTPHYTLEELEDSISALADDPGAQLVMALAGFLGLRPSEITGLRWEDCGADALHVRRAVTRGAIGPTKTAESVASLPLIAPVRIPLLLWREKSGSPLHGWVFPNKKGGPMEIREFCRRRIRPRFAAKKIEWKGLYAGRRTAATILTQLTGNPIAASQLLRHRNMGVTMSAYIKADRAALAGGLKMLEERTKKTLGGQ